MSHFLGVPVRDGDQVLGIIFAANKVSAAAEKRGFTERDEEILSLFAAHAAIALTNARLYERSRELSVLQERSRLARDLHDAVTQKLFSIRAHARAAAVLAAREPVDANRVRAEIEVVGELGAEAHAELRAVIDGLAPPDLEAAGLAESLRRYAVLAGRAHGVPVTFTAACLPPLDARRPRPRSTGWRRRRCTTRCGTRARPASRVALSRTAAPGRAGGVRRRPRVRPRRAVRRPRARASMRERAAAAGGRLTIRSGREGNHGADDRPGEGGPMTRQTGQSRC